MLNVLPLQQALEQQGRACGPLDGRLGPQTLAALCAFAVQRPVAADLIAGMWRAFPPAGICDSRLRLCHALAQAAHETLGFSALVERGGPTYCSQYDGRYGNRPSGSGDGYRYRGRGLVELTFHDNYRDAGVALGLPLVENPDLAAEPATAARIFAWYWTSRHVAGHADADDIIGVTKAINGGLNGLEQRRAYLARLEAIWPAEPGR